MKPLSILLIQNQITAAADFVATLGQHLASYCLDIARDVPEVVADPRPADVVLLSIEQIANPLHHTISTLTQLYPQALLIVLAPPAVDDACLLEAIQAGAADYAVLSAPGLLALARRLATLLRQTEAARPPQTEATILAELLVGDESALGTIRFDAAHVVQSWNAAAARLFGLTPGQVEGRPVDELPLPLADISRLKDVLDQAQTTLTPFNIDDYPLETASTEPGRLGMFVYPVRLYPPHTDVLIFCNWLTNPAEPATRATQLSQDLQVLLEANREISRQLALQPTLEKVLEQIKSLLLGDNCQIYLLEKDNITLRPVLAVGSLANAIKNTPLKANQPPFNRHISSGHVTAAIARQVYPDIPFPPDEFLLSAPLTAANGAIGLVIVSRRRFEFSPDDMSFFESLVQQASSAINNARMFEETQRSLTELEIVYSTSMAMATRYQGQDVLTVLIQQVVEAVRVNVGIIVRWEEEYQQGIVQAVGACKHRQAILQPGDIINLKQRAVVLNMLRQQRPVFLHLSGPSLDQTEQEEMQQRGIKSRLMVPLITKGQSIGWLELADKQQERLFTGDEVRLSRTLASQIAVAMQNAYYVQQTEQTLEEATALYRVASALTTLQEPQAIISMVLQEYLQALNLYQGSIVLFDFATRNGVVKIHIQDDLPVKPPAIAPSDQPTYRALEGYQIPLPSNPVYEQLMRTHQAVTIPDPRAPWLTQAPVYTRRLYLPPVAGWADEEAFSALVIPIKIRNEIVGALVAENTRTPTPFNRWMISLGQAMADQMGIGLQNVKLFEAEYRRREQAETLQEVSAIVSSSLNLDEVLERILDQLSRVVDFDSAAIHLIEGKFRRVIAGRGFDEPKKHIGRVFPVSNNSKNDPGAIVISSGEPAIHANISETFSAFKGQEYLNVKSWMGIPLIARDRVIGLISIDHFRTNAYTQDDAKLALAFANQVAVALENARLYELEVRELERELKIAHQIQETLLPQHPPEVPGLDIAGKIVPARQVGGDFFHFFSTDANQLGVAIGDVSGKGIPAALYMAAGITAIDTQIAPGILPGELLNVLNSKLYNRLQENKMNIALQIATFMPFDLNDDFVALTERAEPITASLMTLASAGMIAPIGATRYGCKMFPVGALPVGAVPNTSQMYVDDVFFIEPDTAVVFTSDGIVEAQNSTGEMFGFDRLERTILQIVDSKNAAQIVDHIINSVKAFIGMAEQHDDMTVVVVVKTQTDA